MLIDITRLVDRHLKHRLPTGVDRVSLAYLFHYRSSAKAMVRFGGRWLVFAESQSMPLFDALHEDSDKARRTIRHQIARAYAGWGRQDSASLFLNTGHSGLDQPGYAIQLKRRRLRPVFFLHDLIPISHPEYCRPGEADKHHRRLDTMLATGCGLIVNSQATKGDLVAYAENFKRDLPPVVVAPLAPGRLPDPGYSPPLDRPYFLVLGTVEPRKNHLLLLHLWRQLVAQHGASAPTLVVIGQRGWECEQVVDLLERCEALKHHVIELPRCSDQTLSTWLRHARALLFPSFVEGFGMPLVESLAHGVPVVASDLGVFREVGGDVPEYLDPLDGRGWHEMILDYSSPVSDKRDAQCRRLSSFRPTTWGQHFEIVDAFLDQVLSKK
ncbi:glycosyltransferase family 1 protein [Dechloromonas sp.]|uniref:glycosyltransferase family 4 protein n=1 Tax=Dechloromonas sp. TaxID=1917218 RepID=UPI001208FF89|nr:glycosyltransferase family 1 protein [Dechloromonas sp.]MBU3698004.1 glycosyltransferase family 4 protein [Dechloromonas sp.]TEX49519.1 MAG: glycosyl transferase family 1 [Rhodocyclaceae bacterium]